MSQRFADDSRRPKLPQRELGLALGFHNHDGELRVFGDGPPLLERLLVEMPELVPRARPRLGVVRRRRSRELVARAGGRAPLVHIKDFRTRDERRPTAPSATAPSATSVVAPAAVAAGVEWLLVEQDEVEGPELDAAARSFEALDGFVAVAA